MAKDLITTLVDAEWLENDLHEMELCIELGGDTAKRRYEMLKERVNNGLSRLEAPQSWTYCCECLCWRLWNDDTPNPKLVPATAETSVSGHGAFCCRHACDTPNRIVGDRVETWNGCCEGIKR